MADQPETINPAVSVSDKITDGGMLLIETALVKACQVYASFLAWPIISQLFQWGMNWVFARFDDGTKKLLGHAIIDGQTSAEGAAAKTAKDSLLAAEKSGDPNALSKADSQFDDAMAHLIHWDGS